MSKKNLDKMQQKSFLGGGGYDDGACFGDCSGCRCQPEDQVEGIDAAKYRLGHMPLM